MKLTGFTTADELLRIALDTLEQVRGEGFEDLDPPTRAAIDEAEAQYARGEGMPLDEAFARLRQKHLGQ